METQGQAEHLIQNVIGCGPFQIILFVVAVLLGKFTTAFTISFMTFGNYNPGWRCLDNSTAMTATSNGSITTGLPTSASSNISLPTSANISTEYTVGSCSAYQTCRQVEFNPETSTIVTEWGLLCDKSWMVSLTISVQMAGMLVGSFLGGQLADWFGRKKTLYASVTIGAILQLVSSYSFSWEMFTAIRFFLGGTAICNLLVGYLYMSETMTAKWRAETIVIPDWQMGAVILVLSAMFLKDWRQLEFTGFIVYVIAFIPFVWVPETLRWLEVQNHTKAFKATAKKMAQINKRVIGESHTINVVQHEMTGAVKHETTNNGGNVTVKSVDTKKHTVIDIFRKGYRYRTFAMAFLNAVYSLIYYGLAFGVKSMFGDFYINLLLVTIADIPFCLITMVAIRHIPRKKNCLIFILVFILCVLATAVILLFGSESAKTNGSIVLIATAKGAISASWYVAIIGTTELYPTVVRGLGVGWGSTMARVGGILAPFLISNDQDSLYLVMFGIGAAAIVCGLVNLGLPEMKGQTLTETFETSSGNEDKKIMNGDTNDNINADGAC